MYMQIYYMYSQIRKVVISAALTFVSNADPLFQVFIYIYIYIVCAPKSQRSTYAPCL